MGGGRDHALLALRLRPVHRGPAQVRSATIACCIAMHSRLLPPLPPHAGRMRCSGCTLRRLASSAATTPSSMPCCTTTTWGPRWAAQGGVRFAGQQRHGAPRAASCAACSCRCTASPRCRHTLPLPPDPHCTNPCSACRSSFARRTGASASALLSTAWQWWRQRDCRQQWRQQRQSPGQDSTTAS